MKFYSPGTNAFYDTEYHGPRTLMVPDANWVAPAEGPDALPPLVEVANPDCRMPDDVVAVTDVRHAELFAGQSEGKVIIAGGDGHPTLADPPAPPVEAQWASLRVERARRLLACDWTQLGDADLSQEQVTAWRTYRQALRDLPANTGDPSSVQWPAAPL